MNAVLYAPIFRLQSALRHKNRDLPVGLVVGRRVVELTPAASRSVSPGLSPTQAKARCPHLELIPPQPAQEKIAQHLLLQIAETFTPYVESTAPGVITMELPLERTFTESDFQKRAVETLHGWGLEVKVGVASTPNLAQLAAKQARPILFVDEAQTFLSNLTVQVLEPSAELATLFHDWGLETVVDFLALPAGETCARLGPEAVRLRQLALGGTPHPLKLIQSKPRFQEAITLDYPIETLEPLLFLLRRFLASLCARLELAHLVAGKLRLTLRLEKGDPYQRVFTVPQPTRDLELLVRMLHTHLENFSTEEPLIGLEISIQPVRAVTEQFHLWERGLRDPHRFAETLARVEALLGPGQAGTVQPLPTHHPEGFALALPPDLASSDDLPDVPYLRYRPAIPARVYWQQDRPVEVQSEIYCGAVIEATGPWLLSGQWWEAGWQREEWDIATPDKTYRLVREKDWVLEGVYA